MLRFFRKMRKALIPESRFGRYLFYAIGVVVLVVIGYCWQYRLTRGLNLGKTGMKVR